ncbi:hypothetical protein LCGC14_2236880, partial [marine sediment metagenome]
FSDDFEGYPLNDWPSSNWTGFGGNDSDHSANYIAEDPEDATNKVFRLYGVIGSMWSAGAEREFALPDDFAISLKVYNGGESIPSNGHQVRATLGSKSGTHWSNPGRGYFWFHKDGNLYAADGLILQSYDTERWYDMTVAFSRSQTDLTLHYWVDGIDLGSISLLVDPAIDDLQDHIELTAQAGSAYFDDIVVTPEPATLFLLGLGGLALRRKRRAK